MAVGGGHLQRAHLGAWLAAGVWAAACLTDCPLEQLLAFGVCPSRRTSKACSRTNKVWHEHVLAERRVAVHQPAAALLKQAVDGLNKLRLVVRDAGAWRDGGDGGRTCVHGALGVLLVRVEVVRLRLGVASRGARGQASRQSARAAARRQHSAQAATHNQAARPAPPAPKSQKKGSKTVPHRCSLGRPTGAPQSRPERRCRRGAGLGGGRRGNEGVGRGGGGRGGWGVGIRGAWRARPACCEWGTPLPRAH